MAVYWGIGGESTTITQTMNALYTGYSQHRDVAPQTRKLHDHLISRQRIETILPALVVIAGAVAIIYTWN